MFGEEEDIFMIFEQRDDSMLWGRANDDLGRQLSQDRSDRALWSILLDEPITLEAQQTPTHQPETPSAPPNPNPNSLQQHLPSNPQPVPKNNQAKSNANYEKNICAYISKKIVQCFMSGTHRRRVQKLCIRHKCSYSQAMEYYGARYKEVFGISQLGLLVTPESKEEQGMKEVFLVFLQWFLREKYMLYLLKYGKMTDKDKYIEFKNKYLLFVRNCVKSTHQLSNLN